MNATTENNVTKTARQQFEELIQTSALYLKNDGFQLMNESEYAEVLQNIQDHKYLVNEGIPFEITMDQALFAWYENVYHPVMRAVDEVGLPWSFPGATRGELFLWVTRHWHFLKQEKGREISAEEAARSYRSKFGKSLFSWLFSRTKPKAA
jgi:hypothetical protein